MSFPCSLNISDFGTSENASTKYFIIDPEAGTSSERKLINLFQASCVHPIHEVEL